MTLEHESNATEMVKGQIWRHLRIELIVIIVRKANLLTELLSGTQSLILNNI